MTRSTRTICLLSGICILGGAVLLAWHGVRASIASQAYYAAKYGPSKDDVRVVLKLCETTLSYYPWNYHACLLATEKAYVAAGNSTNPREETWLRKQEQIWCDRGLALNHMKSQLRLLKAWALARQSPIEGARYWEEFVDWDYWDEYNHRVLVELYARAGELERADACLDVIVGRAQYREAEDALRVAWERRQNELDRQRLRENE